MLRAACKSEKESTQLLFQHRHLEDFNFPFIMPGVTLYKTHTNTLTPKKKNKSIDSSEMRGLRIASAIYEDKQKKNRKEQKKQTI